VAAATKRRKKKEKELLIDRRRLDSGYRVRERELGNEERISTRPLLVSGEAVDALERQ
jgi:hypothetical protein